MTDISDPVASRATGRRSSRYRWYVLFVLTLTYTSSYMDRQIVTILLEDIRAEFTLSDTQLGLLSGVAFSIFYAILGLPIARLADRLNRVNIVAIAIGVWSGMTVLSSTATSFAQLFLARVGVGVGEAGGTAPAHAIISDYFPVNQRSFAISVYSLGTAFGALLGLVLGGFIAEYYGWRTAFIVAGLPGLAIAVLLKLSVREPVRGGKPGTTASSNQSTLPAANPGLLQVILRLWKQPVYRCATVAHVLAVFVAYAVSAWLPTLYLRQFDLGQGMVGAIVGLLNLVGGVSGLLAGGYLSDRLGKKDLTWYARLPAYALLLAFPVILLALAADDIIVVSLLFGLVFFLYQASHGPGLAIIQLVAETGNRAQAAAFVFFLTNLLGLGTGPVLVGVISDLASDEFPDAALALAIGCVSVVLLIASYCFRVTGKELRHMKITESPGATVPGPDRMVMTTADK